LRKRRRASLKVGPQTCAIGKNRFGDGDEHLLGDPQKLTQQAFPVGEAADMLEDGV
jgi:hypothetical protein